MEVKDATARYRLLRNGEERQHTEIGPLPIDWEVRRLNELASIRTGIAKNGGAAIDNPVLVHYLRVANVQDGYLDLSEMRQLKVRAEDVKRYAVLPGDMLMNEGGDLDKLGRGALWNGAFEPCVHQNHVFVVRCGSRLLPELLSAWTGSVQARRFFMLAGRQTTNLASINKTSLGQFPVPLPPTKGEQQSIAEALSDADALIEFLSLLLKKKREIKQGVMQELLTGQRRLPGFDKAWTGIKLSSLGFTYGGLTGKTKAHFGQGQARYITFMNVVANVELNPHQTESVDVGAGETQNSVSIGDLLFNGSSETPEEVALCSYVGNEVGPLFLNSFCFGFRPHRLGAFCGLFMAYFFRSESGRRVISALAQGATRYNISKTALLDAQFVVPEVDEQFAIAEVLTDFEAEIAAIEVRLAKAREFKQGMMQALLTGRIRLTQ